MQPVAVGRVQGSWYSGVETAQKKGRIILCLNPSVLQSARRKNKQANAHKPQLYHISQLLDCHNMSHFFDLPQCQTGARRPPQSVSPSQGFAIRRDAQSQTPPEEKD